MKHARLALLPIIAALLAACSDVTAPAAADAKPRTNLVCPGGGTIGSSGRCE